MTTKLKAKHGGKRANAGRPRKVRTPSAGPIDPEAVLHEIAGDAAQPASARVAAAKALMATDKGSVKPARQSETERALAILRRTH